MPRTRNKCSATRPELGLLHKYATVAGVPMHWAEAAAEDTSAVPVVLLHGLQDCYLGWRPFVPWLARHRRVLLPDLPGHGRSGHPDVAYDLPWYARVVAAWLQSLGLEEVDIVGHSLGGGIAQMLLLQPGCRIRRMVLASAGGLGREISPLLRLAALPHVVERFGQPFLGVGARLAMRGVLEPEALAEFVSLTSRPGAARAFARTVRDLVDWRGQRRTFSGGAHDIASLPAIAVISGDRDRVIPVKHAEALARLVEGVQVTLLNGCGHFLHYEQPDAFARIVSAFLDAPYVPPARLRALAA